MALKDILKPKSDDEIYNRLIEIENPSTEDIFNIINYNKTHLLIKLLKDRNLNPNRSKLWKRLINDLKRILCI